MSEKKHVAANADGLFKKINRLLVESGVSTKEFPFTIHKLQLISGKPAPANNGVAELNALTERKCVQKEKKLIKMKDPFTGKTIIQLVEVCVKFADEL